MDFFNFNPFILDVQLMIQFGSLHLYWFLTLVSQPVWYWPLAPHFLEPFWSQPLPIPIYTFGLWTIFFWDLIKKENILSTSKSVKKVLCKSFCHNKFFKILISASRFICTCRSIIGQINLKSNHIEREKLWRLSTVPEVVTC